MVRPHHITRHTPDGSNPDIGRRLLFWLCILVQVIQMTLFCQQINQPEIYVLTR
jgi:hypothetical protein